MNKKDDLIEITLYVSECIKVNVRTQPSMEGEIIGTLSQGTKVTVYEISGKWAKISRTEDKWVSLLFLRRARVCYVHGDKVPIMAEPYTKGPKKLQKCIPGTCYKTVTSNNKFLEIIVEGEYAGGFIEAPSSEVIVL